MISLITLFIVFILIAVRRFGPVRLEIWQIMCGGALIVLLGGGITPADAVRAVDWEVILFLIAMFSAGQVLEMSGWLSRTQYKIFRRSRNAEQLLFSLVFFMGFASALFMNDTLAIIGTPVVLLMSRKYGIHSKPLLLALAFSLTVGSALSPVGNPQNLLIAVRGGLSSPFVTFFKHLIFPTLINLAAVCLFVKMYYRADFTRCPLRHAAEHYKDERMVLLAKITVSVLVAAILLKAVFSLLFPSLDFSITYVALAAAFPGLVFSGRRLEIIKNIDWTTIAFFTGMFILMQAVWNTGFFQSVLAKSGTDIRSVGPLMAVSVIMSQLISNVPFVALCLPLLTQAGASENVLMALAASSTVAGNMFILGAASNVIIIQAAEKKYRETVTFWEFARIGVPLTAVNVLVYYLFLR